MDVLAAGLGHLQPTFTMIPRSCRVQLQCISSISVHRRTNHDPIRVSAG